MMKPPTDHRDWPVYAGRQQPPLVVDQRQLSPALLADEVRHDGFLLNWFRRRPAFRETH